MNPEQFEILTKEIGQCRLLLGKLIAVQEEMLAHQKFLMEAAAEHRRESE